MVEIYGAKVFCWTKRAILEILWWWYNMCLLTIGFVSTHLNMEIWLLFFHWQIAFFVELNHDCVVECLPTCQSEKNPPKWVHWLSLALSTSDFPSDLFLTDDFGFKLKSYRNRNFTSSYTNFSCRFTPIKYEDYLLQRYKDTHVDLNTYKWNDLIVYAYKTNVLKKVLMLKTKCFTFKFSIIWCFDYFKKYGRVLFYLSSNTKWNT